MALQGIRYAAIKEKPGHNHHLDNVILNREIL
jgi:hypothetical protein